MEWPGTARKAAKRTAVEELRPGYPSAPPAARPSNPSGPVYGLARLGTCAPPSRAVQPSGVWRAWRLSLLAYRCGGSTGFTPVSRLTRDFTRKSRSTRSGCPGMDAHGRAPPGRAHHSRHSRPTGEPDRETFSGSAPEVPNHIQNASLTVDRAEFLQL